MDAEGIESWEDSCEDRMSKALRFVRVRRSIFKIPEILYRHNPSCYHPTAFSIGPIHHGKPHLLRTENFKLYYTQKFLDRNPSLNLPDLIRSMKDLEPQARSCYDIQLPQNEREFLKILAVDGCFLIELMLQWQRKPGKEDPIFYNPTMREQLLGDLVMLENQIPWFVLDNLYDRINPSAPTPLHNLLVGCLRDKLPNILLARIDQNHGSDHLLDLLRRCHLRSPAPVPSFIMVPQASWISDSQQANSGWISDSRGLQKARYTVPKIPTATSLAECGVKFERGSSESWVDVEFNKETGTLVMTPLTVDELTEPLLRNLICFEQCYGYGCGGEFTSYAVLMDKLVNDTKDAQVLCSGRIIDNWLSPEDVVRLFTNLYRDTSVEDFCYHVVVEDMNEYCQRRWPRWRAAYIRNWGSSRWRFAAIGVPILTLVQTIFTVAGYNKTS